MLVPNLRQMLDIGYGCGLQLVGEAYSNYMQHYDLFFFIANMKEQLDNLHLEMRIAGLIRYDLEENLGWCEDADCKLIKDVYYEFYGEYPKEVELN